MAVDPSAILTVSSYLEQVYRTASDPTDKAAAQALGLAIQKAIATSAVYVLPRSAEYLTEYRTAENWADLREKLATNQQAVFNHGDPGPENNIITLVETVYPATDDTPEIVSELVTIWMRYEKTIVGYSAALNIADNFLRMLPFIAIDSQKSETNLGANGVTDEPPAPDELASLGSLYLGILTYLNAQLTADAEGQGYGDGVRCVTLMDPMILMGQVPEWLRNAA